MAPVVTSFRGYKSCLRKQTLLRGAGSIPRRSEFFGGTLKKKMSSGFFGDEDSKLFAPGLCLRFSI